MSVNSSSGGWDVDMNGSADFTFSLTTSTTHTTTSTKVLSATNYNVHLKGRGNVHNTVTHSLGAQTNVFAGILGENSNQIQALNSAHSVKPGGVYSSGTYDWFVSARTASGTTAGNAKTWMRLHVGTLTYTGGTVTGPGFTIFFQDPLGNENFVGFRFNGDDGTHAGWARLSIASQKDEGEFTHGSLTISEWAYESTPGSSIQVGAIPETRETVIGLGVLALGAAGLRRWRKGKQAA